MKEITLNAFAKINLTLKIIKKLRNGYHALDSIFSSIDIADRIKVKIYNENELSSKNKKKYIDKVLIVSPNKNIPQGKSNIVFKMVDFMRSKKNLNQYFWIYIKKNIPVGAGLGGGSSDAAAVFFGINKLLKLKYPNNINMALAKKVGADVPFFIQGGTAMVNGIGEKIKKIKCNNKVYIVLVNPGHEVSTKWVYSKYDKIKGKKTYNKKNNKNIKNIFNDINILSLGNDLEKVVLKKYKILEKIKSKLFNKGAYFSQLSGSGPTIFGLFKDRKKAKSAVDDFNNNRIWSKLAVPTKKAITII